MSIDYNNVATNNDYSYQTAASTTVNPTLKNKDGTNFTAGKPAMVWTYIEGTGTSDTDQWWLVGYAGSGTSDVASLSTTIPGSSNRPLLYKDTDNLIKIKTGHGSSYTIRVRVLKIP